MPADFDKWIRVNGTKFYYASNEITVDDELVKFLSGIETDQPVLSLQIDESMGLTIE